MDQGWLRVGSCCPGIAGWWDEGWSGVRAVPKVGHGGDGGSAGSRGPSSIIS